MIRPGRATILTIVARATGTALADPSARVGLDAQEIAPIRCRQPGVVYFRALLVAFTLETDGLLILNGDIDAGALLRWLA